MPLPHDRPNETLGRELDDVARESDALLEYLRAPNAIPKTFPTRQLEDICQSLADLPQGTAEGCRVPLEYARRRLPAIRREHFLSDDKFLPMEDEDNVPPLARGMGLDRLLKDLIASVTTALDDYRDLVTEDFDDTVGPELVVKVPDDPMIREAVDRSLATVANLRDAGDEIHEITDPDSDCADRLHRSVKDAEGLTRLARAELGMETIVLRWYRTTVDALKDYPGLIRRFGTAMVVGVDVAAPLVKRWEDFWSHLSSFGLKELSETGEMLVGVAERLEKSRPRTLAATGGEDIDARQIKAEHEARKLILSGKRVPPDIATLVRHLDLSGEEKAPTEIPDFGLVTELGHISGLDVTWSNVETLDFMLGMRNLTSLNMHAHEASDLSPLLGLTALRSLNVRADKASDLSPLADLTSLTSLNVWAEKASDLSPLAGLTALTSLIVRVPRASDLSPLAGLTALTSLDVRADRASDLSPLAGLTALTSLDVRTDEASDLSPLASLTSLTSLHLRADRTSDLSPLAGLTALKSLVVRAGEASDLSPLASLTALTSLGISSCPVVDLSPLRHLKNLRNLRATSTKVTDWSPVAHVPKITK